MGNAESLKNYVCHSVTCCGSSVSYEHQINTESKRESISQTNRVKPNRTPNKNNVKKKKKKKNYKTKKQNNYNHNQQNLNYNDKPKNKSNQHRQSDNHYTSNGSHSNGDESNLQTNKDYKEPEEPFDFDIWIQNNDLLEIKHVFIKHKMITMDTLSMQSESFRNWMNDTFTLEHKHLMTTALSAMEKLPINKKYMEYGIKDEDYYANYAGSDTGTYNSQQSGPIPPAYRSGTILSYRNMSVGSSQKSPSPQTEDEPIEIEQLLDIHLYDDVDSAMTMKDTPISIPSIPNSFANPSEILYDISESSMPTPIPSPYFGGAGGLSTSINLYRYPSRVSSVGTNDKHPYINKHNIDNRVIV